MNLNTATFAELDRLCRAGILAFAVDASGNVVSTHNFVSTAVARCRDTNLRVVTIGAAASAAHIRQ